MAQVRFGLIIYFKPPIICQQYFYLEVKPGCLLVPSFDKKNRKEDIKLFLLSLPLRKNISSRSGFPRNLVMGLSGFYIQT